MKLENRVSTFVDDPNLPCEAALKKMYSLLEKYASFSSIDLFVLDTIDGYLVESLITQSLQINLFKSFSHIHFKAVDS